MTKKKRLMIEKIKEREKQQQQEEFNKLRDEKYEREKKERHEAFNNLNEESQKCVSIINEMNDTFSNWGLDLTSLETNIVKGYPVSTILIDHIKTVPNEESSELQLWKLIRKYITLEKQKVKMDFLDFNENFYHLLYWGDDYLEMDGIDLLYMIFILLDNQILKTPNELKGIFKDNRMMIQLPEMTAVFRNDKDTYVDFSIQDVGNLNILVKRK